MLQSSVKRENDIKTKQINQHYNKTKRTVQKYVAGSYHHYHHLFSIEVRFAKYFRFRNLRQHSTNDQITNNGQKC